MNSEKLTPTIVLVHGAFEDASIWNKVIPQLQREGYPVVAFANPLLGVAVDSAYLRSVLDRIQGPVILAAHSYGGAVITQAGTDPKVKGLVYASNSKNAGGSGRVMQSTWELHPTAFRGRRPTARARARVLGALARAAPRLESS